MESALILTSALATIPITVLTVLRLSALKTVQATAFALLQTSAHALSITPVSTVQFHSAIITVPATESV